MTLRAVDFGPATVAVEVVAVLAVLVGGAP
jgi:hypothetical protein